MHVRRRRVALLPSSPSRVVYACQRSSLMAAQSRGPADIQARLSIIFMVRYEDSVRDRCKVLSQLQSRRVLR